VVDPGLLRQIQDGSPYVGLGESEVFADARFVDRPAGDYRLAADSPFVGRGVTVPMELNSHCLPCDGNQVLTRQWALTRLADAPDPNAARPVYGTQDNGHYRLQPLPALHPLVDLDAAEPGTPGLNLQWRESGQYPCFTTEGEADAAQSNDWALLPDNLLADPSFAEPFAKPGDQGGSPWVATGGLHTYVGTACANLLLGQRTNAIAYQKVGALRANAEYLLCGDMSVRSANAQLAAIGEMYLAAGDPTEPLGEVRARRAEPGRGGSWNTYDLHLRSDTGSNVGQELFVVIAARVEGPEGVESPDPVAFVRWDDLWLLSSPPPGQE
jgi:hypothetical protein